VTSRSIGDVDAIVAEVTALGTEENRAGMRRFGISGATLLGVSVTNLRKIARQYRRDHALAHELWSTGIHEIRILAGLVDVVADVTPEQMDEWVTDFDSWDLCDQTCSNLFDKTPYVIDKAYEWSTRSAEFERRAGFVIMAMAAVHDKNASDEQFLDFLPVLREAMTDERNFVKKGVSWSFRQIGKRNNELAHAVLNAIDPLRDDADKTTRWIARDVSKELRSRA
jgi:3-methyladenine DNA glycosylase AlkD